MVDPARTEQLFGCVWFITMFWNRPLGKAGHLECLGKPLADQQCLRRILRITELPAISAGMTVLIVVQVWIIPRRDNEDTRQAAHA